MQFGMSAIRDQVNYRLNHLLFESYLDMQRLFLMKNGDISQIRRIDSQAVFQEVYLDNTFKPSQQEIEEMLYKKISN